MSSITTYRTVHNVEVLVTTLMEQALAVLRACYRAPADVLDTLAVLVAATGDPKQAARTALDQCVVEGVAQRNDCLLLLEVVALELQTARP